MNPTRKGAGLADSQDERPDSAATSGKKGDP